MLIHFWNKFAKVTPLREVSIEEPPAIISRNIEELIVDKLSTYEKSTGHPATHIYIHPAIFKQFLIQLKDRQTLNSMIPPFVSNNNTLAYQYKSTICTIRFVDRTESDDFILVGGETCYNDHVAEREILGDHGKDFIHR